MTTSALHTQACPLCGQPVPTIRCPECGDEVAVNRLGIIHAHPRIGPRCPASDTLQPTPDALDPETLAAEVVTFGLDGQSYTLALSAANARRLRETIAPYARAGHLVEPLHGNSAKFLLARDRQKRQAMRRNAGG